MQFEINNNNISETEYYELELIIEKAKKAGINIIYDGKENKIELSLCRDKISYKLVTCKDVRKRLQYQEKKNIYTSINMSKDTFYRTLKTMKEEEWPDESYFSNLYH